MSLADYLRLDLELPRDPFERLVAVRARKARLAERVATLMTEEYPDFYACIERLDDMENAVTRELKAQHGGEA